MTELIQKAIDKIDGEAEKISNNYITSRVVQRIIDTKLINDENANKILADKKDLQGCIMYIYEQAKKQGNTQIKGNGAFVGGEDEDLWKWVCEYYGFTDSAQSESKIIDLFDLV